MNDQETTPFGRRAVVVHALAVVGFVALVSGSMWLAVYSTRYVPSVVGRMGAAAVYLGSVFTPAANEPSLLVVSTASTTIPFGDDTVPALSSTPDTGTTVPSTTVVPVASKPAPTTGGKKTDKTIQIGGTATSTNIVLSGLPDLTATITAVGYLATSSAESFVATTTIPDSRPAVKFTIKNIGTNVSGPWRWSATIPTVTAYLYESQPQQSLFPGDSIDYTLGFDQANKGAQTISVIANFDKTVKESNADNNSASAKVTLSY